MTKPNVQATEQQSSPDPQESELHTLASPGSDGNLRPTLVRASAGTGKTYQLTARLLRILFQGASPETILATTFTRKAAGEILDRILLTLADAADDENDEALEKIRTQVGIPTLPRNACRSLLEKLLRQIHRLRVCTLDSLFAQMARSFPFELGLPPAWRLTDEIEEVWLRERAVDTVIASLNRGELKTLLAMLGKGDAKRSVARELLRVVDDAYELQRQCDPRAWQRMSVPRSPAPEECGHAAQRLREVETTDKRHAKKLTALAELLESHGWDELAGDTMIANVAAAQRLNSSIEYYRKPIPEEAIESLVVAYAAVRHHVLSLLVAQNKANGTILQFYDKHVLELKQAARTLGFNDVAVRLARHIAALDPRVLDARLDGAIDHVLLDEFQDTSTVQWQVLRPLVQRAAKCDPVDHDADGSSTPARSFFCVGDPKQAIYGWRGGVAELFNTVADEVDGLVEVPQNTSYRSSPVILDAVTTVFKQLTRHPLASPPSPVDPAKKQTYESAAIRAFANRFPKHESAKESLPGYVRLATSRQPTSRDQDANRDACFRDAAEWIAGLHQRAPTCTIGVLTRTNAAVAQMIFLLERLGVDVSQEGGNPLTDSAAVEMVLSALMMAEHPGDGRWEFHVSSSPLGDLVGGDADRIRDRVTEFGIADTVRWLCASLAPHCDERDTLRLKQLTQLAISSELQSPNRLRDFVRMVREKRIERPQIAPVRVMTVHQAKGLEFDAVVLAELNGPLTRQSSQSVSDIEKAGQPPRALSRYLSATSWHFLAERWQRVFGQQASAAMTEALCLLYVAMTRAKQGLYLFTSPASKSDFNVRTPASLLFHALQCTEDPTAASQVLWESGEPNWLDSITSSTRDMTPSSCDAASIRIRMQPVPVPPHRNATIAVAGS